MLKGKKNKKVCGYTRSEASEGVIQLFRKMY